MDLTRNINHHAHLIKPVSVVPYFDRAQAWLKSPADWTWLNALKEESGHLHVRNGPARFDFAFRQRIEMKQPSDEALRLIAERTDALVNRADVALDFCCGSVSERDDLSEFLEKHLVRRWHSRGHEIKIYPGEARTRYDAPRSARTNLVVYEEDHCRITGELNVVRIEWRATGVRAVRRCGINSPRDLIDFDHRAFWEKRLVLLHADIERVGRYVRNRANNGKARKAGASDKRTGSVILNSVGGIQELLDKYGRDFRIGRVLERMDASALLPVGGDSEWEFRAGKLQEERDRAANEKRFGRY